MGLGIYSLQPFGRKKKITVEGVEINGEDNTFGFSLIGEDEKQNFFMVGCLGYGSMQIFLNPSNKEAG